MIINESEQTAILAWSNSACEFFCQFLEPPNLSSACSACNGLSCLMLPMQALDTHHVGRLDFETYLRACFPSAVSLGRTA